MTKSHFAPENRRLWSRRQNSKRRRRAKDNVRDTKLHFSVGIGSFCTTTGSFLTRNRALLSEIVSRQPYGLAADVWSLGCLLVTLLTGKPPFESEAVSNTLEKVTRADYHLPSYLSREAKALIDQLLQKDPRHRPSLRRILTTEFFHPSRPIATLRKLDECTRQTELPPLPSSASRESRPPTRTTFERSSERLPRQPASPTRDQALKPLITKRLKPLRQGTKYGTVEILSSGHVLLDFVGDAYVMLISGDGERVGFEITKFGLPFRTKEPGRPTTSGQAAGSKGPRVGLGPVGIFATIASL